MKSASALLLLLACVGRAQSPRFDELLARGRRLHEDGKYAEAAQALQEALARKPGDFGAETELASVYVMLGRRDLAREAYERAKKSGKDASELYIEEGYAFLREGDEARAKEAFETLVVVDSANPVAYHHLAVFFNQTGDPAQAERWIKEALRRLRADPRADREDVLHAVVWLADILAQRGRLDEAENACRQGLEEARGDPTFEASLLDILGSVYSRRKRPADEESFLRRAAAACAGRPKCVPIVASRAQWALASFYEEQGRRREAEDAAGRAWSLEKKVAGEALKAGSHGELMTQIALFYEDLGDGERAAEVFRRIVASKEFLPARVVAQARRSLETLRDKKLSKSGQIDINSH